jgi:hypothetical protein
MSAINHAGAGKYFITRDEPYKHTSVQIPEEVLYFVFDTLFNEHNNEEGNGKERS